MESTGAPGAIHVSEETQRLAVPYIPPYTMVWRRREAVEVKGKGLMDTYWMEPYISHVPYTSPSTPTQLAQPPSPLKAGTAPQALSYSHHLAAELKVHEPPRRATSLPQSAPSIVRPPVSPLSVPYLETDVHTTGNAKEAAGGSLQLDGAPLLS